MLDSLAKARTTIAAEKTASSIVEIGERLGRLEAALEAIAGRLTALEAILTAPAPAPAPMAEADADAARPRPDRRR